MKTRVEETIGRHDKGYNCAQAVACTYCDLVGVDEEYDVQDGRRLLGTWNGRYGRNLRRELLGACVLAGMKSSTGNLEKVRDSKGAFL